MIVVSDAVAEIESMEVGEDLYDAKIRVLGEMVKQHIELDPKNWTGS